MNPQQSRQRAFFGRWPRFGRMLFLLLILSKGLAPSTTYGVPVQWRIEDGGNGHFYDLVGNYLDPTQRWSWQDSKVMAQGRTHLGSQGHLVTIANSAENEFLITTFHNDNPWPTWLGLTDNEAYGGFESFGQPNPQVDGWVWVTGEAVTFTGWTPGSPENTGDEDSALMGSQWGDHHLWNDSHGSDHAPFFVEYEPHRVPDRSPFAMTIALVCLIAARFWTGRNRFTAGEGFNVAYASTRLAPSVALGALIWCCAADAFAIGGGQLAATQVNEPGEWRTFAIGQFVASPNTGTGPSVYWRAIPEALRGIALEHYYLAPDSAKSSAAEYGKLDFVVVTDGLVWMLTTARFKDSGDADGSWLAEVRTQAQLESDGWRVISREVQSEHGYAPPGQNQSVEGWILFERTCKAGERFSIRTEKYQSPVVLRNHAGNDLFANRAVLSGLSVSATNSNVNATRELAEPNHGGSAGGKSIWWTWTAPRNGNFILNTSGSSVDTILAVYTGTTLTNLTLVASNDDDPGGGTSSLVAFQAQAGVVYQIAVDTFGGATGTILLNLMPGANEPVLGVARSGKNAVLSWPTNAIGFNLEGSASLRATTWGRITSEVVVNGENYLVKLPSGNSNQFFRLIGP